MRLCRLKAVFLVLWEIVSGLFYSYLNWWKWRTGDAIFGHLMLLWVITLLGGVYLSYRYDSPWPFLTGLLWPFIAGIIALIVIVVKSFNKRVDKKCQELCKSKNTKSD